MKLAKVQIPYFELVIQIGQEQKAFPFKKVEDHGRIVPSN